MWVKSSTIGVAPRLLVDLARGGGRQRGDLSASQAVGRPLIIADGSERSIERDTWSVPVQDGPFDPAAVVFDGESRQSGKQRLSVASPALLGAHEDVFEVNPRLAQKRRIVVKVQREPNNLATFFGEQYLGIFFKPEEMHSKAVLVEADLVGEVLVLCQPANSFGNCPHVIRGRGSNQFHLLQQVIRATLPLAQDR